MSKPLTIKVVVVGDVGVGKSKFRQKATTFNFSTNYRPTTGITIGSRRFQVFGYEGAYSLHFPSVEKRFENIRPIFYRGTHLLIVIYDNRYETFQNIPKWVQEVFTHSQKSLKLIILLGNQLGVNREELHSFNLNRIYQSLQKITGMDRNSFYHQSIQFLENYDFNTFFRTVTEKLFSEELSR